MKIGTFFANIQKSIPRKVESTPSKAKSTSSMTASNNTLDSGVTPVAHAAKSPESLPTVRSAELIAIDALPADERRVQIAAARLRVTLDQRLNRVTPPDVKVLARESF